tara:strand:+ start:161 stop:391 length:231 start_codon:yes stop_codon:yes gene_type:complete
VPSDISDPAAHTAPSADSQRAGHGLLSEQINSRASACYNWTWMFIVDLILIAPSSGSINFALSMQRIMDQVMRVPV